jgi:nitrogen fixation/metabolism regulation signal transduction histidine kinase
MPKLIIKVAVPIILAGLFAMLAFASVSYKELDPGFIIVVLALVLFVFFFGLAIGQSFVSPIKKLLQEAEELSKGNLSSRVYLESKDELAELANTFNKLAEELSLSHEQSANIEKSVAVKVKARTQELQEIIDALEQKVKNRTVELERLIKESNRLQEEIKTKAAEITQLKNGSKKKNK